MARGRRDRRGSGRRSRTGLALAGGGPVGGVYEIGALCALEQALVGLDLEDLDQYVGVSAGAVVGACLANGLRPGQQARALVSRIPGEPSFVPESFFVPAYDEWVKRAAMLPRVTAEAIVALTSRRKRRAVETLERLARVLPVGVFDNEGVRSYLSRLFAHSGRTDDFRKLAHRLVVVAADLESGRPVLFGRTGWEDVPISRAVQASTALPGLYAPVKIAGRYCVDGVLLKTVHASIALESGVKLLFCINPIVPVDTTHAVERGELNPGTLVHAGLPTVLSQTYRTLVHSRMEVGMERYAMHYPEADVILFEPPRDELSMFFGSIFSFGSRREVCELGFEATRRDLLARRRTLGPILARHGIRLDVDALKDRHRNPWNGMTMPEVAAHSPFRRLEKVLRQIEHEFPGGRKAG